MPIFGDPAHGAEVRLLADEADTMLATFVAAAADPQGRIHDRPVARQFTLVADADPEAVARRTCAELPGIRVMTDDVALASAFVVAGANLVIGRTYLAYDLDAAPPPLEWAGPALPDGIRIVGPHDAGVAALEALEAVAYPPGHVDYDEVVAARRDGDMATLLDGRMIGPLLEDGSAVAVEESSGRAVAAVLACNWDGAGADTPWTGGPYVADVFRHPDLRGSGIGKALLQRTLVVCSLDGATRVGMAVTEGNPAALLYEAIGFRPIGRKRVLDLPGTFPSAR